MPPLPPDESRSEEARPCRACQPPRLAFRLCRARRPGFYHTARVMGGRPPVQAASSAGRCALCSSCPAFLSVLPVRLQVLPGSPRLRLGPSGPRRPRPRCSNRAACHAPPGSPPDGGFVGGPSGGHLSPRTPSALLCLAVPPAAGRSSFVACRRRRPLVRRDCCRARPVACVLGLRFLWRRSPGRPPGTARASSAQSLASRRLPP